MPSLHLCLPLGLDGQSGISSSSCCFCSSLGRDQTHSVMPKMRGHLFISRAKKALTNVMTTSRLGTLTGPHRGPRAARMGRRVSNWTGTAAFLLESDVGCLFPDPKLRDCSLPHPTEQRWAMVPVKQPKRKDGIFLILCLSILLNLIQGKI